MRRKKINLLMILLVLLIAASVGNVNAKNNATSSVTNRSPGIRYAAEGKGKSATKTYRDSVIKIRFNGKSYDGYCIDPKYHLSASMNCGPMQSDSGIIYLVQEMRTGAHSHAVMHLAFRMYAVYTSMNKAVNNEMSAAIVRYLQVKMGDQAVIQEFGSDPNNFLWGTTAEGQNTIDEAYRLAEAARNYNVAPDGTDTSGQATMLTFNKVGSTDTTVTYRVTSPSTIDASKMKFTCVDCSFVSEPVWTGTSALLEVTTTTENCQFQIEAEYPSSGLYACTGYGENTQTILIDVQVESESGLSKQVFEGALDSCTNGEDCCTLDPITPGYMEGNINNCCTDDTHSEASEYDLNDLFCYSDELKVDHAYPKCNSDYYLNTDAALNDYCEMYCTERISVDLPGAITATSGRYFTLTTTQQGTKSPYIEGYKRCRILVHYDEWESDYGDAVQSQVDAYNDYQYNKAYELTYKDAIDNVKTGQQSPSGISCSCSYSYTEPCQKYHTDGTPYIGTCTVNATDRKSGSCNVTYDRYEFTKFYDYYGVKIDERYENSSLSGVYDRYEIVNDPNAKGRTTHSAWVADNIDTSSCDSTVSSMETWSGNCTYSCSRPTPSEAENNREDVDGTYNYYVNSANAANSSFNAASDTAKKLEEDLYKCDNYFTEFEGADAEANYNLDVSMDFYYTQVYLDDYGEKILDANYVDWSDEGCTIDGPITSPDHEISAPNYSSDYGTGTSTMNDFKNSTLDYHNSSTGYQNYIDETFEADRLFTHDAKYHGVCQWEEEQNQVNTLVPSGEASESTSEMNFTEHGREYRVYLTTFDGTYETHWNISGLGSDGKFDDYFLENGTTCAAENPADTSMFTCKLHVEHEVVLTGYCNGTLGTDTTTDPEDCDPLKEGYNLFTFKIVDPVNLFPSGTTVTEDGETKEIAYNWTSTAAGQQVMDEIQNTAADDETFSPSNLTYSFTVTPSDMQHIKNYNDQQDEEGGYSDFELNCSCPRNGDGTYAGPCVQCKSTFLENLANGIVRYDGANHQVTGWSNPSDSIQGIRNKNNW